MRYVDWSLWGAICAALIGLGFCALVLFHIIRYLVLEVFWRIRKPKEPAPDFYQHIAAQAIAGLEEEWRAKQR